MDSSLKHSRLLDSTRNKTSVLLQWIRITIAYLPDAATWYHDSVTLSQCSILPHYKLPVCCMMKLSITLSWFWIISQCSNVIPDTSGKAQNTLFQNVGFHVWQYGNTIIGMLSTALLFYKCGHSSAPMVMVMMVMEKRVSCNLFLALPYR